jgi:hypothetical protein
MTGDRTRDIGDSVRQTVIRRLRKVDARADWLRMVREVVPVEASERAEAFGEELPVGLRLLDD